MNAGGSSAQSDAQSIISGSRRAAGKLITRIESGDPTVVTILRILFPLGARVPVLGVTGPPGAGKSTITAQLVERLRARGERIAILAVDPSSPFTGGAILGDRVRMGRHNTDPGVFIRSMAARGRLGGLANAVGDTLIVLDAMGIDRIVIETVGVGQSEIDIMCYAETILIAQTPAGGDAVQAVKAGILEIGDIFVVNKADTEGADRTVAALQDAVAFRCGADAPETWRAPILKTRATDGLGIDAVIAAIDAHGQHFTLFPDQLVLRRRKQIRAVLVGRLAEALRTRYEQQGRYRASFEYWLEEVLQRRCDPTTAAIELLAPIGSGT
jgi:LAO/AO transport system kinase